MKTGKFAGILVMIGFTVMAIFASQNVIALSDGISLPGHYTTDTITIDSWQL